MHFTDPIEMSSCQEKPVLGPSGSVLGQSGRYPGFFQLLLFAHLGFFENPPFVYRDNTSALSECHYDPPISAPHELVILSPSS